MAAELAEGLGEQSNGRDWPDGRGGPQTCQVNNLWRNAHTALKDARARRVRLGGTPVRSCLRLRLEPRPAMRATSSEVPTRDGRSYVFMLQGDETSYKVAIRAVTVGRRQGTEVEIAAGLTGVERVVAQGAGFLADGDVVRLGQPVATTPVSPGAAARSWS